MQQRVRRMAETRSVRALMSHLIDYAGLFPPATLDMRTTVGNYAAYLASPDEWMLGRLIVPVARLDEFEREAKTQACDSWLISALTAPAGDAKLGDDLARIAEFNKKNGARAGARIDVIELKATSSAAIDSALEVMPDDLFAFFELPVDQDVRGLAAAMTGSDAGAKIRTGGTTPDLYPTPDQVARFIRACVGAGVPFKATAGMHHPLRQRNEAVGAEEFGFLNFFLAGCGCAAGGLSDGELVELLCERDAGAFQFNDDGVAWRELHVSTVKISQVRERIAIAFGSCSFDEPREDLRALDLL